MAVNAYFEQGFDKSKALRAAGYSEKSCNNGFVTKFFNRPEVQAEINRRMQNMAWKHEYVADNIVQRLIALALSNHGEIILKLQQNDWKLTCLTEEELYAISSVEEETKKEGRGGNVIEVRTKKIRFKEVLKAIELLGRWMGEFNDKMTLTHESDTIAEIYAARPDLKKLNGAKTIDHEPKG